MMTIDDIIFKIENYGIDRLPMSVPPKDKKILKSMSRLIRTTEYITESQANLIVKVLKENLETLNFVGTDLIPSLKLPTWSRKFKTSEKIRNISIKITNDNVAVIEIEASYSKELKKTITALQKSVEGDMSFTNNKIYWILLTEKNLVKVVDALKKYNFQKSTEICEIYEKIKAIDPIAIMNNLDFQNNENEKMKEMLQADIGFENISSALLLHDRNIAFQYLYDKEIPNIDENSLLYKIATRKNPKIFVNSQNHSLKDLAVCLRKLNRLPVLLILDEYNPKNCIEIIKNLKSTLDDLNFYDNVGVYFRFDNTGEGVVFNKLIAEYNFNKNLDPDNKIAILSNGKIPKFFIKTNWHPKAVISFTNNFRNNKTSVYCNNCDLVVYYNQTAPLSGNVDAIV